MLALAIICILLFILVMAADNYGMRQQLEWLSKVQETNNEIMRELAKGDAMVMNHTQQHRIFIGDIMQQQHEWLVDILNGRMPPKPHLRLVKKEEEL